MPDYVTTATHSRQVTQDRPQRAPRSTIPVVHASQPLCSLSSTQPMHLIPSQPHFQPQTPVVASPWHRPLQLPKAQSRSWAPVLRSQLSALPYCRGENTNCTSSLVPLKVEFISKDRFHCSPPAPKSSQGQLSWYVPPGCILTAKGHPQSTAQCPPSNKILPYNLFCLTQKIKL